MNGARIRMAALTAVPLIATVALVLQGAALAAPRFGSIEGSVADSGSPVKGAMVKIYTYNRPRLESYGVTVFAVAKGGLVGAAAFPFRVYDSGSFHVKADRNGRFRQDGLKPGTYAMAVEADGVTVELVYGVRVESGKVASQNFDITLDRAQPSAQSSASKP